MTSINWPVVIGVFISGGILGVGIFAALIQGVFQHPTKRANIANTYTDTNIKIVQDKWQEEFLKLKKSHNVIIKQCEKRDDNLAETRTKLNETRVALRLLTKTVENGLPILQQANPDSTEINKLSVALDTVRKILDRS